jgi:hypothetical protein
VREKSDESLRERGSDPATVEASEVGGTVVPEVVVVR